MPLNTQDPAYRMRLFHLSLGLGAVLLLLALGHFLPEPWHVVAGLAASVAAIAAAVSLLRYLRAHRG